MKSGKKGKVVNHSLNESGGILSGLEVRTKTSNSFNAKYSHNSVIRFAAEPIEGKN